MILELDEKYRVISDKMNMILQEKSIVKGGKNKGDVIYKDIGYFGNLSAALHKYTNLKLNKSGVSTVDELVEFLNKLEKKIDEIGKEINLRVWNK